MFALAFARGTGGFALPQESTGPWGLRNVHPYTNGPLNAGRRRLPPYLQQRGGGRLFSSAARTDAEKLMTDDALAIIQKAIDAVDPYSAIRNHVKLDAETRFEDES